MSQLEITNTYTIDASADRLWEVMVDEFLDVAGWASGLDGSGENPATAGQAPPPGAPAAGRSCVVPGLGATDERFTVFDPEGRRFGYSVEAERLPGFVHDMQNVWTFVPVSSRRTRVEQRLTAEVTGLGVLMKPLMARQFRGLLATIREDLEAYATTGRPSARKQAELAVAS